MQHRRIIMLMFQVTEKCVEVKRLQAQLEFIVFGNNTTVLTWDVRFKNV